MNNNNNIRLSEPPNQGALNILIHKAVNPRDYYLETIFKSFKLGSRVKQLWLYVIDNYDLSLFTVELVDMPEYFGINKASYYSALNQLLDKEMLFRSTKGVNVYFINPLYAPYNDTGSYKPITFNLSKAKESKQKPNFRALFEKNLEDITYIFEVEEEDDHLKLSWESLQIFYYYGDNVAIDVSNQKSHGDGLNYIINLTKFITKKW